MFSRNCKVYIDGRSIFLLKLISWLVLMILDYLLQNNKPEDLNKFL